MAWASLRLSASASRPRKRPHEAPEEVPAAGGALDDRGGRGSRGEVLALLAVGLGPQGAHGGGVLLDAPSTGEQVGAVEGVPAGVAGTAAPLVRLLGPRRVGEEALAGVGHAPPGCLVASRVSLAAWRSPASYPQVQSSGTRRGQGTRPRARTARPRVRILRRVSAKVLPKRPRIASRYAPRLDPSNRGDASRGAAPARNLPPRLAAPVPAASAALVARGG